MNVTTTENLESVIKTTVMGFIKKEAERVASECQEKIIRDMDVAIRKAVTDTAVEFTRMLDVKDGGDTITIHIADRRGGK